MEQLEQIIGYTFQNKKLLKQALTHSSYANEKKLGKLGCNERLEFLGDAVLELISSDFLYAKFTQVPEGELTKKRASLVCEPSLAYCARQFGLPQYLLLGKGENMTGGRNRDSIVSDATEALLGAIYLDGGMEAVTKYIMGFMEERIESTKSNFRSLDCKTHLQEVIQKTSKVPLKYAIVDEHGPDHNKVFVAEVTHDGAVLGKGSGKSKKEAEQNAANDALERMNQAKK